jgi:hypothetical protein
MALPIATHDYFVNALDNAPLLLDHFLGGYSSEDAIWNYRTDPGRFTLREVLAHVADWNDIYRERLERTRAENHPLLPNCDEGAIALARNYAGTDPLNSLRRFRESRHTLIELVRSISHEDWSLLATREGVGDLSIGEQIALIAAHDAYHIRQVLDYLAAAEPAAV